MNKNCFTVLRRQIGHFVSKPAFDMEGLGPKIIDKLMTEGLVKDASDLLELKVGDLEPLERFAEKSAQNIVNSIETHKTIALERFIYALGIPLVGIETAEDIAKKFGTLEKLLSSKLLELGSIYGIGEKVADAVFEFISDQKKRQFIECLLLLGVKVTPYHSPVVANKLGGKIFVVTGSLETMTRDDAHKKIIELGGETGSSVTSKTNYLVVGDDPGENKVKSAQKFGTRQLTEQEFIEMMK
jgi:DNA ligase (NAD+)